MNISKSFQIQIPAYDIAIKNIKFSTNIDGVTFDFEFQYFNDQWNGWATFNGATRLLGVIPYEMNWIYYQDYTVVFDTALDEIGFEDLVDCGIWVFKWE